jgi:hypothetical protein
MFSLSLKNSYSPPLLTTIPSYRLRSKHPDLRALQEANSAALRAVVTAAKRLAAATEKEVWVSL